MFIPKRYGQSRADSCPFCGSQSTTTNVQSIPVCAAHRKSSLENMKCACGSYLDMRKGKFGVFFNCISCGAVSLSKALEINDVMMKEPVMEKKTKKNSKGEIQIRSDDPNFFS